MNGLKRLRTFASGLVFLISCSSVGSHHTPDVKLETNFVRNQSAFDSLLAEVISDHGLEMIRADAVRFDGRDYFAGSDLTAIQGPGFTMRRWDQFKHELHELGLEQVTKSRGIVEFRVDPGAISNGDSYKGYEYSPIPPVGRLVTNLDQYRLSPADKDRFGNCIVYKPLKGNWYLYLFVSR